LTIQESKDQHRDSRYPAKMPERDKFGSDAEYDRAMRIYWEGQATLAQVIFAASSSAVVVTFPDGFIAYANLAAQKLFGLTSDDLARHRATDFLFDADRRPIGKGIAERLSKGESIRDETVYVKRHSGQYEMYTMVVQPVFAPGTSDVLVRVFGTFSDPTPAERENASLRTLNRDLKNALETKDGELARLRQENEELQVRVCTDEMTGVMNKSAFSRDARQRIEEQRRRRGSAGLLFLDPDDFKSINDTYGHDFGDELIQELASRGRVIAEKYGGLFARFGGDEFYALFTGLDAVKFEMIIGEFSEALPFNAEAEAIHSGIRSRFHVGVAFGGCFRTAGVIPDLRILIAEADRAMYECKRSGKGADRLKSYMINFSQSQSSKPPIP
jgi:diguanylate cyclase (GGDEF)-like protein/PAS domain S-box-containing protein